MNFEINSNLKWLHGTSKAKKKKKLWPFLAKKNKTMLLHNNVIIILFNSILLSNESENLSRIIIHTYMLYLMWIMNTLSCSLVSRIATNTDCVMFTVLLVTVPCSLKIINKAADKLLKSNLDKSRIHITYPKLKISRLEPDHSF